MLLLAVSSGAYVKVLWFCWSLLVCLVCSSKVNFESSKISKCFWDLHDEMLGLLNIKGGCDTSFNFPPKMTSWAQSLFFFKSLFSSFGQVVVSCVPVNGVLSSANNFALEDRRQTISL